MSLIDEAALWRTWEGGFGASDDPAQQDGPSDAERRLVRNYLREAGLDRVAALLGRCVDVLEDTWDLDPKLAALLAVLREEGQS